MDISLLMPSRYPDLMPSKHQQEIRKLLIDMHSIDYFALSFPGRPQIANMLVKTVQDRLDQANLSERYRKALEFKLEV